MEVFGTDSFLARPRRKTFPVVFVVRGTVMVTFLESVLSTSLQHVRDLPEFAPLMSKIRSKWPRCLLWHGWLPGLSGITDDDPWTSSIGELAFGNLERCLGAYAVDLSGSWTPPDYWLMMLPWKRLNIQIFGLIVAGRIFRLWVVVKLLVLVFI